MILQMGKPQRGWVLLLAGSYVAAACASPPPEPESRSVARSALAGSSLTTPDAAPTASASSGGMSAPVVPGIERILGETASLVEGTVSSIDFTYSEWDGPQTVVTLSGVADKLGGYNATTIEIRQMGGPLPNGEYFEVVHQPTFVLNATYLVFLTRNAWNFSPIVERLALREETLRGNALLVEDDGRAVIGLISSSSTVRFSEQALFGPAQSLAEQRAPRTAYAYVPGFSFASALSPDAFVRSVRAYAESHGLNVGGQPQLVRAQPYAWNHVAVGR